MKGIQGLVLAAALGVVGAVCNWFYVYNQASGYRKVSFVMIDPDARINVGDRFQVDHFQPVDVPAQSVGNLIEVAYLWEDRELAVGVAATRSYVGGEILLRPDVVTLARQDPSERLGPDEVTFPVPVDSRVFVSENYNPGDKISFFAPGLTSGNSPTPVDSVNPPMPRSERLVGPFRILLVGSRKGSLEVERASGRRASREDVITISLNFRDGTFDEKAQQLFQILEHSGGKGVQVVKHPVEK